MNREHRAKIKGILDDIATHRREAERNAARLKDHIRTVTARKDEIEAEKRDLLASKQAVYDPQEPDRVKRLLKKASVGFTTAEEAKKRAATNADIDHQVAQLTRDIELLAEEEQESSRQLAAIVYDLPEGRKRLLCALSWALYDHYDRARDVFVTDVLAPMYAIREVVGLEIGRGGDSAFHRINMDLGNIKLTPWDAKRQRYIDVWPGRYLPDGTPIDAQAIVDRLIADIKTSPA